MTERIQPSTPDSHPSGEPAPATRVPDPREMPFFDDSISTVPDGSARSQQPAPPPPSCSPASPTSDIFIPVRLVGRPKPGQVLFNRYRVLKTLGEGGMGSVYLVHNLPMKADRALKLIMSEIADDPQVRARFKREAKVMSRLRHRNAVAIHDAVLCEDAAFIEMEVVHGTPLRNLIKGTPMPISFVSNLLEQLCGVLQAAHELGIVHRDLKPSNLMILHQKQSGRDVLKVLDFGIAKLTRLEAGEADDVKTQADLFLGTPHYASPEQIRGDEITGLSDLYSVGVILYELLVGRRPFGGAAQQMIRGHLTTAPPAFSDKNPQNQVPESIEQVVMRCLEKQPEHRPRTALHLLDEFREAMDPRYAGVRPPSPGVGPGITSQEPGVVTRAVEVTRLISPPTPSSPRTRQRSRFLSVSLTALGVGACLIGLWIYPRKEKDETRTIKGSSASFTPSVAAARQIKTWAELGIEPVEAAGTENGWPVQIRRQDPNTKDVVAFHINPSGYYLPEGYEAEGNTMAADKWPRALIRTADGVRFLRIAGDTYTMGSEGAGDDDVQSRPSHEVKLSGYYLQENEVTNREIALHVKAISDTEKPKSWMTHALDWQKQGLTADVVGAHPATYLSHRDAERFAARFAGGMLPTEAQWEFAARSRRAEALPFVWNNNSTIKSIPAQAPLPLLCHVGGASEGVLPTKPPGSFKNDVTAQGIYDLTGNVREWCRDVWGPYRVAQGTVKDPCNHFPADDAPGFVVRGSGYATKDPRRARVTSRDHAEEAETEPDIGFRVVIEPPQSPGLEWNSK